MNSIPYYIYIIRCQDDSLYTGITTDLQRRFNEHLSSNRGAKYTHVKKPQKIEIAWQTTTRSLASKLEYLIKHLKKSEKEQLIAGYLSINVFGDEFSINFQKL